MRCVLVSADVASKRGVESTWCRAVPPSAACCRWCGDRRRCSLTCSHQHEGAGRLPAHNRWAALPCFLGLARSTRLTAVHCIMAWLRILCLSCQRRLLPPFTQADDGCWVFPRIRLPRLPTKPTGARPPVLKLGQAVEVRGAHAGAPYPSREAACLFVVQPHTLPLFSEHIWSPAAAAMCTALLSRAAPAVTHLQHIAPHSRRPSSATCGGGASWCQFPSSRGA